MKIKITMSLTTSVALFFLLALIPFVNNAYADTGISYTWGSNNSNNITWEVGFRWASRVRCSDFSDPSCYQHRSTTLYYVVNFNGPCVAGYNKCGYGTIWGVANNGWRPPYGVQWGTACIDPYPKVESTGVDESGNTIYDIGVQNITANAGNSGGIFTSAAESAYNGGVIQFGGFFNRDNCPTVPNKYSIDGHVFIDKNRDGNWDPPGESAYSGGARINRVGGYDEYTYTNSNGYYRFYHLRPRDDYGVHLSVPSGYSATTDRTRDGLKLPPDHTVANGNPVDFGIAPNAWDINVNIFLDRNRDGNWDKGGNNPEPLFTVKKVTVTKTGNSKSVKTTTDGTLSFTDLPRRNDYNVTLTVPYGFVNTNSANRTSIDLPSNSPSGNVTLNFGLNTINTYDITGLVYVDENGNGGAFQPGIDTRKGGVTVQSKRSTDIGYDTADDVTTCLPIAPATTCGGRNRGEYRIAGLNAGTYNIRIVNPDPAIFTIDSANPRTATVNNTNGNAVINFRLARRPAPPPRYTITGGIFVDTQPPKEQKSTTEPYYAGTIRIVGGAGNAGFTPVTVTSDNTTGYTIPNLLAGNYQVQYTSLPATYQMTYPANFVPPYPSFDVTVGAGICNDSDATNTHDQSCVDGNIIDLRFGIKPIPILPWFQTTGGDFRIDENLVDKVSASTGNICSASTTQAYASVASAALNLNDPGIVFSGTLNPDLGQGTGFPSDKANAKGWFMEGKPFGGSIIKTSFNYVLSVFNKGGLDSSKRISLFGASGPCDSADRPRCTLPNNLAKGVYTATTQTGDKYAFYLARPTGALTPGTTSFTGNRNYVFLINGSLRIDRNINVDVGSTLMFIVKGDIVVSSDVTRIEGVYSADEDFIIYDDSTATADVPLTVQGSIIANAGKIGGILDNRRDLGSSLGSGNASCPTIRFSFRPDFVLNMPSTVREANYIIQEVAPGPQFNPNP